MDITNKSTDNSESALNVTRNLLKAMAVEGETSGSIEDTRNRMLNKCPPPLQ